MRDQSRDDNGVERGKPSPAAPHRTDTQLLAGTAASALRHGAPGGPAGLLALQRTAGNAAVSRALAVQRHAGCQEEEHTHTEPVQRSTAVHDVLGASGRPLAGEVRQDMEARFGGTDFSDVRIHDDAAARRSAQEIGARAYTSGSHIVIGDGGGDPHTLAHELTHVVQQRQGPVAGTDRGDGLSVSDPSDRFEVAAEENARRVLAEPAPVQRAAHPADAPGGQTRTTSPTGHAVQRAGSSRGTAAIDRPSRRRRVRVSDLPVYFSAPAYTPSTSRRAGGRYSSATLGPNGYSSRGTDADSSLPSAITSARSAYNISFKAGHLLNADFGGNGRESANLTILTPRANAIMRGFDDPLKNAMTTLRSAYEDLSRLYLPIGELRYGIKIEVSTSGPDYVWGTDSPAKYISSYIRCSATILGEEKINDWYAGYVAGGEGDHATDDLWTSVLGKMAGVQLLVSQANQVDMIDNEL